MALRAFPIGTEWQASSAYVLASHTENLIVSIMYQCIMLIMIMMVRSVHMETPDNHELSTKLIPSLRSPASA